MSPEERIDRSFDGQLSDAEWEALQRDLLEDDALRELYVQRRWLHAQLQTERDSLPSILETSPPKKRSRTGTPGRRHPGRGQRLSLGRFRPADE